MKSGLILPKNKVFLTIYILFHGGIFLFFLCALCLTRQPLLEADLLSMLPDTPGRYAMREADRKMSERTGQNLVVLVSHEDFQTARSCAVQVYEALRESPRFDSLSLYADGVSIASMTDFIHRYRYQLLDEGIISQLSTPEGAVSFADSSLAKAYSIFTLSSLQTLEEDPFLLDDYSIQRFLSFVQNSGTALSPKDGVLAAFHEGRWYVMLEATLSKTGASLAGRNNGVAEMYAICTPLEKDGIHFVYSGTPFHSYKSSVQAAQEISFISIISLLIVIVMLLIIFRTGFPLVASLCSLCLSLLTGFAVTYLAFGSVHALTLVFATSLIGCCIDYSLHYFIHWKANGVLHTGDDVRRHLFTGLSLALVSTELCYVCLFFAPFVLLKQMAVFCFCGILSTYLTTICIFPLCKLPSLVSERTLPVLELFSPPAHGRRAAIVFVGAVVALGCGLVITHADGARVQNDITKLYTMEGRLKEDSQLAYGVLHYAPNSWFIISGTSEEDVLEREEGVCERLRLSGAGKGYMPFIATSSFIPSIQSQKRSWEVVRDRLLPLAERQYEALGYGSESVDVFSTSLSDAQDRYVTPETEVPASLRSLLDSVWLGKINDQYYSIIMPTRAFDTELCEKIAFGNSYVSFEHKVSDINGNLDRLTKTILMLFGIAYLLILAVMKFFYGWRLIARLALLPPLCMLSVAAFFIASGNGIDFFVVIGCVLVFGLGVDYSIYLLEEGKRHSPATDQRKLETFAIFISFLTTAFSFGSLALSSFVPVRLIGLSILIGLTTAFACTFFLHVHPKGTGAS